MDDYSTDENILNQNSQGNGNSKRIKKVRKQKSNNELNSTNPTEQTTIKRKKKSKKASNQQASMEKTSELTSEPDAIDVSNSLSADHSSFTKYNSRRPLPIDQSSQINSSELNTETNSQDFSSDLSQRVPTNMTKEHWEESQNKAIQGVHPINEINIIISEDSSSFSENDQKSSKKSKGKKKIKKKRLVSSNDNKDSLIRKSKDESIEDDSTQKQSSIKLPDLTKPPKRRGLFDIDDIDNKRKPKKLSVNPSTDKIYSDDYSLSERDFSSNPQRIRDIDKDTLSSNINYSSLITETDSGISESDEIDISQTLLPNESDFKQLQKNAVLSIKSTDINERSASLSTVDNLSDVLATTSANETSGSDLSQVQNSYFKERRMAAVKEIKDTNLDSEAEADAGEDVKVTTSISEAIPVDLTNNQPNQMKQKRQKEEEEANDNQSRSNSGQKLKSISFNNNNSTQGTKTIDNIDYSEEEEEEDGGNESMTHSQLNPTVDNLSDKFDDEQKNNNDHSEELASSDHYFNSELIDDVALREVKTKVDDLAIPESTKALMKKGIRVRPKEDDSEAAYFRLELPEKNPEYQVDSEVSELDVEFNTDKKKFKRSIVSQTPTNRIPSTISPTNRKTNGSSRPHSTKSKTSNRYNNNDTSNIEFSGISDLLSESSDIPMTREVQIGDLIQEDSLMYPTKFDVKQADSDDEGSLFEQFKRNANFLSSSSSDDQNPTPAPIKSRSTPNNSVTEVVENTYTEIDSISGSSGNSKHHKDKTVTRGRITLYKLSSSSSFDDDDQLDDDINSEIQERGIKPEFSSEIDNIDDDENNNNNTKPKTERFASKPSYDKSSKAQNCYFDGNVVLKLTIVEAKNLPKEEHVPLDPYCTVAVSDKKKIQRTKTIRSSTRPIWDQQFKFNYNIHKLTTRPVTPSTPTFQNSSKQNGIFLFIQIISEDKFSGDREISSVQLGLKDIPLSRYIDQWIKLTPSGNFRTGGEIRLNLFIEPEAPISSISPRKAKIQNDDNPNYILSPRAQTPSAHANPFAESLSQKKEKQKQNQKLLQKQNQNQNQQQQQPNQDNSKQKTTKERQAVSQTPNFVHPQRPWTDSSSSELLVIDDHNSKKHESDIVTYSLAEYEEEEELGYDYPYEEDQNGFHTEIKAEEERSKSNKNESEDENINDDHLVADQELLENQDESDDLSPIEPAALQNDEADNSLNLISLPAGNAKGTNVKDVVEIEEEEEEDNEEKSIDPLDELGEDDSDDKMTSLSSGDVNQIEEYNSYN